MGSPEEAARVLLEIAHTAKRPADRIAAIRELLDRAYGKAPAFASIEGMDPLELDGVAQEIQAIAAELKARDEEAKARRRVESAAIDQSDDNDVVRSFAQGHLSRVRHRSVVVAYAVVDDALSPDFPLGDALAVFVHNEDAERLIEEVRGDDPEVAAKLRIEGAGARRELGAELGATSRRRPTRLPR